MLGFEPTQDQQNLFLSLSNFTLSDPENDWLCVVTGYAGTGKTSALSAYVQLLENINYKYVLLAPTGRAAKVFSNFTYLPTSTIHKHIYRQKSIDKAVATFELDFNKAKKTIYIVDEVSLITTATSSESAFGSGDVLDDLIKFVRNSPSNKLILVGDPAQLPPIGLDKSPALDIDYLSKYSDKIEYLSLREVVRQEDGSGILMNATALRKQIENNDLSSPRFELKKYKDICSISGGELIEELSDSISQYGLDEVVVLCRSNARANKYNQGIRTRVLDYDEQLQKGDKVMIVKNCYNFDGDQTLDFIANGDVATLRSIKKYEERYGLHFASATLEFEDYGGAEVRAKIILDTLESNTASLGKEEQNALFEGLVKDYSFMKKRKKKEIYKDIREDPYFNALQIKYSIAITGHKSQGGQWKCVFIDNIMWKDEITIEDKKWLYTALTRGVEKVYLVNFPSKYLDYE